MPMLNRDDFMNRLRERLGDDASDEAVHFLEDMSDTYDELSEAANDTRNWRAEAERIDKEWRDKYTKRFFEGGDPEPKPEPKKEPVCATFDTLFTSEK